MPRFSPKVESKFNEPQEEASSVVTESRAAVEPIIHCPRSYTDRTDLGLRMFSFTLGESGLAFLSD